MNQQQARVVARLIHHAQRFASNPAPGRRLPLEDAIDAAKALPDPGCIYCNGNGQLLSHAADCWNDSCVMNGAIDSCTGQVVPCGCSIMDVLEDK